MAIVVTSPTWEDKQLLGIPSSKTGRGEDESQIIYDSMVHCNVVDRIFAACCDTTASNMGPNRGACVKLEEKIGRRLYILACRRHVSELIPAATYDKLFGASIGPDIPLFKRFYNSWDDIDRDDFKTIETDTEMDNFFSTNRHKIANFIKNQLTEFQPRDDYEEVLFLVLLIIGEKTEEIPQLRNKVTLEHNIFIFFCLKLALFNALIAKINSTLT